MPRALSVHRRSGSVSPTPSRCGRIPRQEPARWLGRSCASPPGSHASTSVCSRGSRRRRSCAGSALPLSLRWRALRPGHPHVLQRPLFESRHHHCWGRARWRGCIPRSHHRSPRCRSSGSCQALCELAPDPAPVPVPFPQVPSLSPTALNGSHKSSRPCFETRTSRHRPERSSDPVLSLSRKAAPRFDDSLQPPSSGADTHAR